MARREWFTAYSATTQRSSPRLAEARGIGGGVTGETFAVLTHSGSNPLWFATTWIAPEGDVAIIAASNAGGDRGARATDAASGLLIQRYQAWAQR